MKFLLIASYPVPDSERLTPFGQFLLNRMGMRLVAGDFTAIQYRINPYQVKGSKIAYADGVGLTLREGLFRGSPIFIFGALISLSKFYLFLALKRMN